MLKTHLGFETIEDGLNHEAFAQQDLVGHWHEATLHVAADAGDEVQATLPECLEQFLTDVAFVGMKLARQVPGHPVGHGAVGGGAWGDLQRHDLTFVVDDEVQLETVEPRHAGVPARGWTVEHRVAVDTTIVADGKFCCVVEIKIGLLAAQAVQQHRQRREQTRRQTDKAIVMREIAKTVPILMSDPTVLEHREMLEW